MSSPDGADGSDGADGPHGGPQAQRGVHRGDRAMSPERMQQHMARRAADLKSRLKIEPAQESAWTSFTEAMKPPADMMQRRQAIRAEMQTLTTPERIDRMRTLRTERQSRMDKRGDAVKTFYAALNAEQKKIFDTRPTMQGRSGHGGKHGRHHGRMHSDADGQEHGQPQS